MLTVLYSIGLGVNGALAGSAGQLSGVAVKLAGVDLISLMIYHHVLLLCI